MQFLKILEGDFFSFPLIKSVQRGKQEEYLLPILILKYSNFPSSPKPQRKTLDFTSLIICNVYN